MFDWSDTVFQRRNVTRRRISNTLLQPTNVASSVQIGRNGRYVFGYEVINRGRLGILKPT
jgi:hypothetical protein